MYPALTELLGTNTIPRTLSTVVWRIDIIHMLMRQGHTEIRPTSCIYHVALLHAIVSMVVGVLVLAVLEGIPILITATSASSPSYWPDARRQLLSSTLEPGWLVRLAISGVWVSLSAKAQPVSSSITTYILFLPFTQLAMIIRGGGSVQAASWWLFILTLIAVIVATCLTRISPSLRLVAETWCP